MTSATELAAERSKLTALSHELFTHLFDEFIEVEPRLVSYDEKLTTMGRTHPECQRLLTIPGIGPLTATALVAAVSDAEQFHHGRQFAAWLGLVPRQHTTGGKARLLGISKRGDGCLCKLLVHGARAAVQWVGSKTDRWSQWTHTATTPWLFVSFGLWCMNWGNANEINTLRFSALNRKT